jgi:predicted O-methyltransferase YrrM
MINWKEIEFIDRDSSISKPQCQLLYDEAKRAKGIIVELGSYKGRSTVALALGSKSGNGHRVYAVDPWCFKQQENPHEKFLNNIEKAGVSDIITPIKDFSYNVFERKEPEIFDNGIGVLFLDPEHSYKALKKDLRWVAHVKPGGVVAFDAYNNPRYPGVTQAIEEYLLEKGDLKKRKEVGMFAVFEKIKIGDINTSRLQHIEKHRGVSDIQGSALYRFAKQSTGPIVEIGGYEGRSATWLAMGSLAGNKQKVFSIDPWELYTKYDERIKLETFKKNIKKAGLTSIVQPVRDFSHNVFTKKRPENVFKEPIGLLFVDGSHNYWNVKKDLEWISLVKPGGFIAFHDYYHSKIKGVRRVVNEYLSRHNDLKQIELCASLIIFRKIK